MRTILEAFSAVGIALSVLFMAGLAVTVILLPPRYRKHVFLFSPFVGYGVLSGASHYLGKLGLSTNEFAIFLVSGLAVCSVIVLYRFRRSKLVDSGDVGVWIIVAAVFTVGVIPLVHAGFLTTVGQTIDAISHVSRAELMQTHPLAIPVVDGEWPITAWAAAPMKANLRMGDVYLVAVVASLTGQRAYELLTIVSLLFFGLTAPAVFVFCRVTLLLRKSPSLVAAVLVASSNLLLWAVYDDFLSQVIGTSLVPVTTAIGIAALRSRRPLTLILAGLLLSALISTYIAYAVVVLGAVIMSSALSDIFDRSRSGTDLVKTAVAVVGILAATIISNGVGSWRAAKEFWFLLHETSGGGGNILTFPHPGEILGLLNHPNQAYGLGFGEPPGLLTALLFGVLIGLAAIGLWAIPRRQRIVGITLLLTAGAFVVSQRWGVAFPKGYPYGYFKSLSILVVFVTPMLGNGIAGIPDRLKMTRDATRLAWVAVSLCASVAVLLGFWNTALTIQYASRCLIVMDRSIAEVGTAMEDVERGVRVVVSVPEGIRQNWIGYLLKGQRVIFDPPLAHYPVYARIRKGENVEYAVVSRSLAAPRSVVSDNMSSLDGGRSWVAIWENEEYSIYLRTDGVIGEIRATDATPLIVKRHSPFRIGTEMGLMTLNLGSGTSLKTRLSGLPRTLRVVVADRSGSNRLTIDGVPYDIPRGLSEIVIPAGSPEVAASLKLESDDELFVVSVAASSVIDNGPIRVVENNRWGVCFIDVGSSGAFFEAKCELITVPRSNDPVPYRFGLHVAGGAGSENPFFGAWGVDFERRHGLQTATMKLNLQDRTIEARLDGRPVRPDGGPLEASQGGFLGQVVLWDLNDTSTFVSARTVLRFEEVGDSIRNVVAAPPVSLVIFAQ